MTNLLPDNNNLALPNCSANYDLTTTPSERVSAPNQLTRQLTPT
jgi:hypothetical protein